MSIKTKIREVVIQNLLKFKGFKVEDSFYIFGDPRSGTTWLAELLKSKLNASVIWEPFDLKRGLFHDHLNSWRPSRQDIKDEQKFKRLFREVIEGKTLNNYSVSNSSIGEFLKAKNNVVKFVRANNLFPFINENYTLNYKPIHLIRHPFAVVRSNLIWHGINAEDINLEVFHDLVSSHYNHNYEYLCAIWCMHNQTILQYNSSFISRIFYEDLLQKPNQVLKEVFETWGLEFREMDTMASEKKSSTTKDFKSSKVEQIGKWENFFTDEQKQRMQEILNDHGLTVYHNNSPLPVISS